MGCRFADTEIGHVHELSPQRLVRTATERRALRLRPSEPVLRAFPQPLALEFGHGRENAEQHAPVRAGRVTAIGSREVLSRFDRRSLLSRHDSRAPTEGSIPFPGFPPRWVRRSG